MVGRAQVDDRRLLAELNELLREFPSAATFYAAEGAAWAGRAQAVMTAWDSYQSTDLTAALMVLRQTRSGTNAAPILETVRTALHRARYDLLLRLPDGGTKVIGKGEQFNYFDELRKVIQRARQELLFVDPYLNEDFVSRYMPFVPGGVSVRFLGRESIRTLLPAVAAFKLQSGCNVEAKSGSGFHDRFLFLDRAECFQSGASFHQGGRTTPTTLTPMVDAAPVLLRVYESIWNSAQ